VVSRSEGLQEKDKTWNQREEKEQSSDDKVEAKRDSSIKEIEDCQRKEDEALLGWN